MDAVRGALTHRGPDDHGWALLGPSLGQRGRGPLPVASIADPVLLHTRLSVIDLTHAGAQPMVSPNGRYWIVYNGEVYNHDALRTELQALGYQFQSSSDTEVVLAAYQAWGPDCLTRFTGMFALAIADLTERTLFLGRDSFGIKPLFYTHAPGGFAFASEIPALLEIPWTSHLAQLDQVYQFLTSATTDTYDPTATFFAHIKQLPPGHHLTIDLDAPTPHRPEAYWRLLPPSAANLDYADAVSQLRTLFLEGVSAHLRSDVPVGSALSGGIDSSAIVMAMRHLGGPDTEIHTFSYIPDDPELSEERWIDVVEQAANTTGHKVRPTAQTFQADLAALVQAHGEPFRSTSIYAQFCVFRAAREAKIKVTLDGQGADEFLAGYRSYYPALLASLVRSGHLLRAARMYRAMTQMPGTVRGALRRETLERLLPGWLLRVVAGMGLTGKHVRPAWLDTAWFEQRGLTAHPETERLRGGLQTELLRTITDSSLPSLLRYADRNAMAFGVESRVPFVTPAFASFVLSLPDDFLVGPDGLSKRVFRDAMRGLVPDVILDRRDKVGFATTEFAWLRGSNAWVESVLDSPAAHAIPFLKVAEMQTTWKAIYRGEIPYNNRVWRWLSLILWTQQWEVMYDAPAPAAPGAPEMSKAPTRAEPSAPRATVPSA